MSVALRKDVSPSPPWKVVTPGNVLLAAGSSHSPGSRAPAMRFAGGAPELAEPHDADCDLAGDGPAAARARPSCASAARGRAYPGGDGRARASTT